MNTWKYIMALLLAVPLSADADVNKIVNPLPCGIYDQSVRPLIEKNLLTQHSDKDLYTMAITTNNGRKVSIEIKGVEIRLAGERNHVSVFLDGKPLAKTSHQDLPLYLEFHVDGVKYRVICTRSSDEKPEAERSGN